MGGVGGCVTVRLHQKEISRKRGTPVQKLVFSIREKAVVVVVAVVVVIVVTLHCTALPQHFGHLEFHEN